MYLKQDAIPLIVEVKLYNTNSNINIESTLYNEKQFMYNFNERNEVDEKSLIEKTETNFYDTSMNKEKVILQTQSNLLEIDERNTLKKDVQSEYTVSNNIKVECINNEKQFQIKPETLCENSTSRNELQKQSDNIIQDIFLKRRKYDNHFAYNFYNKLIG